MLDARAELQLGTRVPDADVYMLSDGGKRSAKSRFLDAFRTSDGEKINLKEHPVFVVATEQSLKIRHRHARAPCAMRQVQMLYLLTGRKSLLCPRRARLHMDGSNRGNTIHPVVMPTWFKSTCWVMSVEKKKLLYGDARYAVGGKSANGEDDGGLDEDEVAEMEEAEWEEDGGERPTNAPPHCKQEQLPNGFEALKASQGRGKGGPQRANSNEEPVFFHAKPENYYSELFHSYYVGRVIDLTAGDGAAAMAAMKSKPPVPYLGLCLTEAHEELLRERLVAAVLAEMKKESSPLFTPAYSAFLAENEEETGTGKKRKKEKKKKSKKGDKHKTSDESGDSGSGESEDDHPKPTDGKKTRKRRIKWVQDDENTDPESDASGAPPKNKKGRKKLVQSSSDPDSESEEKHE